MKWMKSPPELVAAFDAVLPGPPAERRLMFGYPAAFVNGHMFCSLFQDAMVVRLDEADRARLLQQKGARPFAPMPGRPMKEYVVVPPSLHGDPAALRHWIDLALFYARQLPPKKTSRAKSKPKKPGPKKPSRK
jgi:TfoX/Sxy family transcriptional regulator of competence genes